MTRLSFLSLSLAAFAAATLSVSAHAANDWDWEWEKNNRTWRVASLDWASNIHPQHPSPTLLLFTTAPPPRELWCIYGDTPTADDLAHFDELLDTWTHDFLNIPAQQPIPNWILNSFPPEC